MSSVAPIPLSPGPIPPSPDSGSLIYVLVGAVVLLIIITVYVLYRQNQQRETTLEKLHEVMRLHDASTPTNRTIRAAQITLVILLFLILIITVIVSIKVG